jgi:hypothetical protein
MKEIKQSSLQDLFALYSFGLLNVYAAIFLLKFFVTDLALTGS